MIKASKEFKFEMAHKLKTAYSKKCLNIHGHSYKLAVEVVLSSVSKRYLDNDGMVVDFGIIKDKLEGLIDGMDHALMVYDEDAITKNGSFLTALAKNNQKVLIANFNPTAENMAIWFFNTAKEKLKEHADLVFVRINETCTSEVCVDEETASCERFKHFEVKMLETQARASREAFLKAIGVCDE